MVRPNILHFLRYAHQLNWKLCPVDQGSFPHIRETLYEEEKNIWPKAVAYFRSAQVPFTALVRTNRASTLIFEKIQVNKVNTKIDDVSENMCVSLFYLLLLQNDFLSAKNHTKINKNDHL